MVFTGLDSIFDYLHNLDIPDGEHSLTLANKEVIDIELYNYAESTIFTKDELFGSDTADDRMVVLKFKGDVFFKNGFFSTKTRKNGLVIYASGAIINSSTISMTGKGSIHDGQELLLFRNVDGTFETVPKEGGIGGARANALSSVSATVNVNGNAGADSSDRAPAGGGSGGASAEFVTIASSATAGSGSRASSYSGGFGGGSAFSNSGNIKAYDATNKSAGGGKGSGCTAGAYPGGGLLIFYAPSFNNSGIIESNGLSPASAAIGAGGSGAGSINIFCTKVLKKGTLSVKGGVSLYTKVAGGFGGTGYCSITEREFILISTVITAPILKKILKATLGKVASETHIEFMTTGDCNLLLQELFKED